MFDAVYDLAGFIEKNNIAVFPHDLHHQGFVHQIPQFVEIFQFNLHDTFQSVLGNSGDTGAIQMFSQKHAKVRRRQWRSFWLPSQIDQRKRRTCG